MSPARLAVSPKWSMIHAPVEVRGSELPPGEPVTLHTSLHCSHNRFHFESVNTYKTDNSGSFSSASSAPMAGHSQYKDIHTSGPLWSMRPKEQSRIRMWLSDVSKPLNYNFRLLDKDNNILAEDSITKAFMSPTVKRYGVSQGKIQGAVFIPKEKTMAKTRAVITVYGVSVEGRAPEDTAALLAEQGFVTMAMAFYGAKGQPSMYSDLNIEDYEEAVDYIRSLDEVEDKRVGLFGTSKGGDVCAAMAAFLGEKIGGTVTSGNPFGSLLGTTYYKDHSIKATPFPVKKTEDLFAGFGLEEMFKERMDKIIPLQLLRGPLALFDKFHEDPDRVIPVERCHGPILAIYGADDTLQLTGFGHKMAERARRFGKHDVEVVELPGMGHLVDPPNCPVSVEATHPLLPKGKTIDYGGRDIQAHSLAQMEVWRRMLQFYKSY